MWHNTRRGFNLIRKRSNDRKHRRIVELSIIGIFLVVLSAFSIYGTFKIVEEGRDIAATSAKNISIYNEDKEKKNNDKDVGEVEKTENIDNENENNQQEESSSKSSINIMAMGEIMMGGGVSQKISGGYTLPFKNISEYTSKADYTIANLTTNISNTEDLTNTKSKYIVNKNIVNGFNALGIDGLNVASDHMLDFSNYMFNTTTSILKDSDIDVIGMKNYITYAEKDGIRVAIIGVNNVIIGNQYTYEESGMYIYNLENIKKSIKEAREKADAVIIMTHYGKENVHEVTDVMRWFCKELINAGADIVLGGHALGIYPVEEYNGKLIVYSMGYLIHDTDKDIGKKSALFDINIEEDGTIRSLTITPTYISRKSVVEYYKDNNKEGYNSLVNEFKNGSVLYTYSMISEKNSLVISK